MAQILPLKNKRVTLSLSQKERKQLALSVQKARNPLVMKALTPTYQVKGLNGINLFFWPHNCFNNLQYKVVGMPFLAFLNVTVNLFSVIVMKILINWQKRSKS